MRGGDAEFQRALQEAVSHHRGGRLAQAIDAYTRLLAERPGQPQALHMLGVAYVQAGDTERAIPCFRGALETSEQPAPILANLASAHLKRAEFEQARDCARRSLQLHDGSAGAWMNLGLAATGLGDRSGAAEAFEQAARRQPGDTRAVLEAMHAFLDLGRPDKAREMAELATAPLDFRTHPALYARVMERADAAGDADLAAELYREAGGTARAPAALKAAWTRVLLGRERVADALGVVTQALESAEDPPRDFYLLKALAHQRLGEIRPALEMYETILRRYPDWSRAHSNRLIAMQYAPDADPDDIFSAHRDWARRHGPARPASRPGARAAGRIRVAWVSPRFCAGPVGTFFRSVAAALPREGFEHVFYHDGPVSDDTTAFFRECADRWRETADAADAAFAATVREDGIHVLVEMAGHGPGNRLLALARRPAPLQLSWLDYFHSTGTDWVDGFLADANLAPPGFEKWFTERLCRLPRGRLCYSPGADAPDPRRAPGPRLVLGCFNRVAKLNDAVFGAWAEILSRLPEAELYLRGNELGDEATARIILERAAAAGLDCGRVRIGGALDYGALLREYGRMDLALDPFPFSGCATTCDALWMGVPVITLEGRTLASRQSAALLRQLDLERWVTRSRAEYVERAVALASEPGELGRWRERLRPLVRRRLCDAPAFADGLCDSIRQLYAERAERR